MGNHFGMISEEIDARRMTIEQAAEYLWKRFVAPLEY